MKNMKSFLLISGVLMLVGMIYKFVERDSLIRVIYESLPRREAGLLAGMVAGDKEGIDREFWQYLKNSGLLHVVIVSGSNMILLGGIVIENLAWILGRKMAILVGFLLLWGYAGLTEWQVPVLRAVLLLFVYYWAQLLGRRFDVWRALVLVVGMMLFIDWQMIMGVSFWLSLVAFGAVVLHSVKQNSSRMGNGGGRGGVREVFYDNFMMALWVGVWVMPILALQFGEISLVAPIVSGLVVGMVGVVTLMGGLGAVIGVFVPILGKGLVWLTYPLLKYFVVVTEGFGWVGVGRIRFNWWMLAGYYLILIYFLVGRKK